MTALTLPDRSVSVLGYKACNERRVGMRLLLEAEPTDGQ
jgi:hypothetical protein